MPMSPRYSLRQGPTTAGGRGTLRNSNMEPVQAQQAQRGGRGGVRTPVSTPRRRSHNQAGYRQNQHFDFSFPQPVSQRTRARVDKPKTQAPEERVSTFVEDRSTFGEWKPGLAIGSPLSVPGEDLSRIQLADRHVAQWRHILEYQEGAPHIQAILNERIKERLALDENDVENTQPISTLESTRQEAVGARLEVLESGLDTTKNEMQLENMKGAIAAYKSGAIPPNSTDYTIIWAGHVVDTVPSHASTLLDRTERLDRYHARYGPGALWFEPPLKTNGYALTAKKCVDLANTSHRRRETADQGFYSIQMGFRARETLLVRKASGEPGTMPYPHKGFQFPHAMTVERRNKTPAFSMMLDSGATFPLIFRDDLAAIGIDPRTYPAQTRMPTHVADQRTVNVEVYELDVTILNNDDETLMAFLHEPARRIWPSEADGLGSTVLVCVLAKNSPTPAAGVDVSQARLSGMLPFHACYISSVPGNYRMWLGEDRSDVLGANKMPGQQRYAGFVEGVPDPLPVPGSLDAQLPPWCSIELPPPRVIFEHYLEDGTLMRDDDDGFGRSELATAPGDMRVPRIQAAAAGVNLTAVEPRRMLQQREWIVYWNKEKGKEVKRNAAERERSKEKAARQGGRGLNRDGKRSRGAHDDEEADGRGKKQATEKAWWKMTNTIWAPPKQQGRRKKR